MSTNIETVTSVAVDQTADAVAAAIAALPVLPTVTAIAGKSGKTGDVLSVIAVTNDAAASLGDAPSIRLTGARSKAADTAADALFAELLAADGGMLTLLPVQSTIADNGRAKNNASRIAASLDAAFLRLSQSDRLRVIYGRASDTMADATVHGVTVRVPVPGMFYVMATGGAVKSHPIMGTFYRAITAARKP